MTSRNPSYYCYGDDWGSGLCAPLEGDVTLWLQNLHMPGCALEIILCCFVCSVAAAKSLQPCVVHVGGIRHWIRGLILVRLILEVYWNIPESYLPQSQVRG